MSSSPLDILCIFFCQFDEAKGTELVYQIPDNYLQTKDFDKISFILTPKVQQSDCLTSLRSGNSYVLGYPIALTSRNYPRTIFQFNLCVIASKTSYEESYYIYDILVKKLGHTMEQLEVNGSFDFVKKHSDIISRFINELYTEIQKGKKEIKVNFEQDSFKVDFYFKYANFALADKELRQYHVPIWKVFLNENEVNNLHENTSKIIKCINAKNTIADIVKATGLNVEHVKNVIINLMINDFVDIVFNYRKGNNYKPLDKLIKMNQHKQKLYEDYLMFVKRNNQFNSDNSNNINKIGFDSIELYSMYCNVVNCKDIAAFMKECDNKDIDFQMFIAFGEFIHIIQKRNVYCVLLGEQYVDVPWKENVTEMLNGKNSIEEICDIHNMDYEEFLNEIYKYKHKNHKNEEKCFIITK